MAGSSSALDGCLRAGLDGRTALISDTCDGRSRKVAIALGGHINYSAPWRPVAVAFAVPFTIAADIVVTPIWFLHCAATKRCE
jgi:hypothetical protein